MIRNKCSLESDLEEPHTTWVQGDPSCTNLSKAGCPVRMGLAGVYLIPEGIEAMRSSGEVKKDEGITAWKGEGSGYFRERMRRTNKWQRG